MVCLVQIEFMLNDFFLFHFACCLCVGTELETFSPKRRRLREQHSNSNSNSNANSNSNSNSNQNPQSQNRKQSLLEKKLHALNRPRRVCADCGAIIATWVSLKFGLILCWECALAHKQFLQLKDYVKFHK